MCSVVPNFWQDLESLPVSCSVLVFPKLQGGVCVCGGVTAMHRLPRKRFIHVWHPTVPQTSCHQDCCSDSLSRVAWSLCSQDSRPSAGLSEQGDIFLKRKFKKGVEIQQVFGLHRRGRKIKICPCTGLAVNPSCLP